MAFVAAVTLGANAAVSEVLKWDCEFETRVDAEGVNREIMPLYFTVDTISKKAWMEGNAGFVEVEIYFGDSAFSFIERIDSGAVQATTVTRDGFAVHSRNTVIFGDIVAAQHFGRCLPI
ncbi:hypothetical protein [Shimia haliotis]|uniref:hypothetical protein n=1 Tax=Shimia haliotis TaxID=1280847 RepID=UPI000B85BE40|nr:hypothetical protein [Shimia haliotis]